MKTLNKADRAKIAEYLKDRHIPAGIGNKDAACSIAAINLALTGRLRDNIPDCMSEVIGNWIIATQDAMPDDMRNSEEWRALIPDAAGTGREHENERAAIIIEWMWSTVLPQAQSFADDRGFGPQWRDMCAARTKEAASEAHLAATWAEAAEAADAAWAAALAAKAAEAADAAWAAALAAKAVFTADLASPADVAGEAARAVDSVVTEKDDYWRAIDPPGLLRRLIDLENGK